MRNKAQVKKQMLILAMKMALEKTGLLGGDKVLWSNGVKGEGWEWDRKNSEIRPNYVSLRNEVMKTVNLEENGKLGYRGGGL